MREYRVTVTSTMIDGMSYPEKPIGTFKRLSDAIEVAKSLVHRTHKDSVPREVIVWNPEDRQPANVKVFGGCMCTLYEGYKIPSQ